jgi:hypothetical protein
VSVVSPVPSIIDALVVLGGTIPNVVTYDGFGVTNEVGAYLMIGVEDPDVESAQQSAMAGQEFPTAGVQARTEQGQITCAAHVWTGESGPTSAKAVRDSTYAVIEALAAAIRTDYTLGALPGLLWAALGTSMELRQAQDTHGASAFVIFRVAYLAYLHP